jgi:hypothetical protein
MSLEDYIEVLYNGCYGGYSESEKAIELYDFRKKEMNIFDEYFIERHDPILVKIYHEMGDDFNENKYSKIKIKRIPKKYENCYRIEEYDGLENVIIDEYRYDEDNKKNRIKEVLNCSMTDSEKIKELKKIILIDVKEEI